MNKEARHTCTHTCTRTNGSVYLWLISIYDYDRKRKRSWPTHLYHFHSLFLQLVELFLIRLLHAAHTHTHKTSTLKHWFVSKFDDKPRGRFCHGKHVKSSPGLGVIIKFWHPRMKESCWRRGIIYMYICNAKIKILVNWCAVLCCAPLRLVA